MILSVLCGVSIVMAWTWIFIVLSDILTPDSNILHVVGKRSMLVVVGAWTVVMLGFTRLSQGRFADESTWILVLYFIMIWFISPWSIIMQFILMPVFALNRVIFQVLSKIIVVLNVSWAWVRVISFNLVWTLSQNQS